MFGDNTYEADVQLFEKVEAAVADNLLSNEEVAIVYIGRPTCPYCRKFAKKLSGLAKQIERTIYYVNSEDFSDEGIESFREKHSVRTVPGFLVKNNGELTVICDSSLPEDEILRMTK